MGTQLVIKRSIFYCLHIICVVIAVLCFCIVVRAADIPEAYTVVLPDDLADGLALTKPVKESHHSIIPLFDDDKEEYVPGEVIVKFKDKEGATPYSSEDIKNIIEPILESSKFESQPVFVREPAVKRYKNKIRLESPTQLMQASETDEELFHKAYFSMSKTEKRLHNTAKVSISEKMTVEEAVELLSTDPNVEYAEPHYIYHIAQPVDIQSSDDSSYALPIPEETFPKKALPVIFNQPIAPNDYLFAHQWPLHNRGQSYYAVRDGNLTLVEGTPDADIDWLEQNGQMPTEKVIVAVIDTGVDYTHPDLAGQLWINEGEIPDNGIDDDLNGFVDDVHGYDTYDEDGDPMDGHGHGTHCSGTIAARSNNVDGISGVYPLARIMPVKCFSPMGSATMEDIIPAIQYAVENGAQVLSNSWGGSGYSQALVDTIAYARERGCVFVAAAGNNDTTMEFFPAAYDGVIAVAATDSDDHRARFSNYGSWVDIAAPGVDILSLRAADTDMYRDGGTHIIDENYYLANGTSMAAPHAAGVAAAIVSKWPGRSPDFYEDMLLATSDSIDSINPDYIRELGAGRINIASAVTGNGAVARISGYVHTTDSDFVSPGASAQLRVTISTLLQPISGAVVHVMSDSDLLAFNRASYRVDVLPAMSRITLPEDTFIVSLSEEAELGVAIPIRLELHVDNQIVSTQTLKLVPHNYRILDSKELVSLSHNSSQALTVTPDGSVHVVYKEYTHTLSIKYTWRDPETKSWQEPIIIPRDPLVIVDDPIVASDASGNLYVLYFAVAANGERGIYCQSKLSGDTAWGEPVLVYSLSSPNGFIVSYTMRADGNTIHVVIDIPDSSEPIVAYLKYHDGQWSEPEEFASTNRISLRPVVVLSPHGTLFIAWVLRDEGDIAYLFRHADGTWSSIARAGFTDCAQFDAAYDANGTLHLAFVDKESSLNYGWYHPEDGWLLIDRRDDMHYTDSRIQIGRDGKAHIIAIAYDIDYVLDDYFAMRLLHLQYDVHNKALDDTDILEVGLISTMHMDIDDENHMHAIFVYLGENLSRFSYGILGYIEKELPPPVNHAPVLEPIGDKTVLVGEKLYFEITASDEDGDVLEYTIDNLPDGAVVIHYNKTDINADGYVDEYDFSIFKQHYNSAAGDDNYNIDCDFIEDGKINLSDFALFGSMYGQTSRESSHFNEIGFVWTPNEEDIGQHEVTFIVSDGQFFDYETITIDVFEEDAGDAEDGNDRDHPGKGKEKKVPKLGLIAESPDFSSLAEQSDLSIDEAYETETGLSLSEPTPESLSLEYPGEQEPLRVNKINLGLFIDNPFKSQEFYERGQWSWRYKAAQGRYRKNK